MPGVMFHRPGYFPMHLFLPNQKPENFISSQTYSVLAVLLKCVQPRMIVAFSKPEVFYCIGCKPINIQVVLDFESEQ